MVYLVSNSIDISGMDDVSGLSVQESLDMISSWPVVQFDTETTDLDPHLSSLISMQFGFKKDGQADQIVVDCRSVDPLLYKNILESSYLIGHNLKFDLQFLYNYGIIPLRVYDTMICEQVLYLGYSKKQVSMSLANVLQRYTGIELDKTMQKLISHTGLNHDGIIYAADDVRYLQDIRKGQMLTAQARKCEKAFIVENRFVPAITYLEWCGIHLDETKWRKKMSMDQKQLQKTQQWLNDYVVSSSALSEFVSTSTDKIADEANDACLFTFEPACIVDWNSPQQVAPVFKKLGFNTTVFDKKKGEDKDTVVEKVLAFQTGINDEFLKHYFDFKGAVKATTSYGQGHLNQINPVTNRIHTNFNQIGTVTGRMSSGSRSQNKALAKAKKLYPKDVTYCNMQNLPARGEEGEFARSCFTATEANAFVSVDYSAEESRVQADVWNEKSLLDAFAQGIDTHNLYAKLCFPEELKDVDVRDVKKERPDLRQKAKSAEFELANQAAVMSQRKSGELLEA